MKKLIITIIVLAILGVAYWLISPLFISKTVNEESPFDSVNLIDLEMREVDNRVQNNTSDTAGENDISEKQSSSTENKSVDNSDAIAVVPEPVMLVSEGQFKNADEFHKASGTARLIKSNNTYTVRFEEDFEVTNGPDLYIGLGNNGQYEKGTEIAKLKGNKGSQNYVIPQGIDIENYDEVWIWCKAFSVPFGSVELVKI